MWSRLPEQLSEAFWRPPLARPEHPRRCTLSESSFSSGECSRSWPGSSRLNKWQIGGSPKVLMHCALLPAFLCLSVVFSRARLSPNARVPNGASHERHEGHDARLGDEALVAHGFVHGGEHGGANALFAG